MLSDSFNHESPIDKNSHHYTSNRLQNIKEDQIEEENKTYIDENYISDEDSKLFL